MIMWGWGAMNPTAVQEAAKIGYPMDHFIGIWWSGSEDDARPAGAGGQGLSVAQLQRRSARTSRRSRTSRSYVDRQGQRARPTKDKVGENFYNRGVMNAAIIAEAIRNAQKITGKKAITGEDMRRGLETLKITAARWKELGLDGFAAPMKVTCDDHNGHNSAYMQQWDGTKWVKVSDWIAPMKDKVDPLIEEAAEDYVEQERRLAEAHRACDKSS